MDLRVWGDVEIHAGGRVVSLHRGPERCVLATFALSPRRQIQVDTLIEHVWADQPPAGAEDTIASYVRGVRRAVEKAGGERDWLRNRRPRAYLLDIDPDRVDYHRFTRLAADAREAARAGDGTGAVAAYQQALALRRGAALANVAGDWAERRRYALEQEYLDVLCALYEQQLQSGAAAAVATSARHLVTEVVPTDRMIVLGMSGLVRSGQHAEIRDFVNRAAQRMWASAQARPSAEVYAIARKFLVHPEASRAVPESRRGAAAPAPEEPAGGTRPQPRPGAGGPVRKALVVMTATGNDRVYQAGGNQYIVGS